MLIDEGLELLDEQQCVDLLRGASFGRIGVTISGLPVILPVNYVFAEGAIVFCTGEGTKLQAATERAVVAFEVDAYDAGTRTGWSVLAIGRSAHVTDPDQLAKLESTGLAPAAGGARHNCVRVEPEMITGRRIA
jgi:nitroimidazol reductase NimA-like FMN-containing flavoprotein (pyridoxamine 5'-phosphate oxidase superfamily)